MKKITERPKGLEVTEKMEEKASAKKKAKKNPEAALGEFAEEKNVSQFQKTLVDQYVEKRFRQIVTKQGRKITEEKKSQKQKENDFMKQLYSVPKEHQGKFTELPETEAGERWLSGMVEVELPVEYKLKNIEETEAAKAQLLAPKQKEKSLFHIPSNFNQDFVRA